MKVLNKNTDYAIRALLSLAGAGGERMSAKAIAEEQQLPYQFLRRLMQELLQGGLVESQGGARGGFTLARAPEEISLTEVIAIFQGEVQVSECMFRKQLCSNRSRCVLRHEIMRIEQVVKSEFDNITIGSLLQNLRRIQPAPASDN